MSHPDAPHRPTRHQPIDPASHPSLIVPAIPPIAGSLAILHLAAAGRGLWISHLAAICLSCLLAFAGNRVGKRVNRKIAASAIIILTCIGLAMTLPGDSPGPERWIPLGTFRLYVAPILLPSFIAACSVFASKGDKSRIAAFTATLCVALLLALQPDASQLLGLLVASAVAAMRYRLGALRSALIVFPLALATAWAFSIPDPLEPVPHVEGVFRLALDHSSLAGIAVIAAASTLVLGLWIRSTEGPAWLSAAAAYYAALFACSVAGLTPAPLIGYGAGPILGFGLMAGLLASLEPARSRRTNAAVHQGTG